MNYQTYQPHPDLSALVNFYWTLEVPYDPNNQKQKIIPDGFVEMTFNLADGIKRYTSENDYVVHPACMVMGQRTKSYFIEPLGNVNSFAICFFPYGFASFMNSPLENLVDKEMPISAFLKEAEAHKMEQNMINASDTKERIRIIEDFLLKKLQETNTIKHIVKTTVDALLSSDGKTNISALSENDQSKRRQLERHFKKQIGISPKQLGKVIRLQAALKMLLNDTENLTNIAYENDYFDQSHFIKDFKEFIGTTPSAFLGNEHMALSTLFYK